MTLRWGFEATHYDLSTDQLGTQLDPPGSLESVLFGNRRTGAHLRNPAPGGDTHPRQGGERS